MRYPGILLGESYNGICALTDLFMNVKIPNAGYAFDTAFMLFGPNGCTGHILVPLRFELSLLLKLCKFVHFLCHRFGLGLVKLRLAIHYLRLPCLKPHPATFVKAFKRVG
jgi:hypothetical protein